MIRLRTSRLLLRRFREQDAGDLADLYGDPAVMRYIDDGRPIPREQVLSEKLPEFLSEYGRFPAGLGRFAGLESATGAFVGRFALRPTASPGLDPAVDGDIELGYRLLPAFWGLGYATEAARALVDSAFADCGAQSVAATTMTVNAGSRRVLEKAGLRLARTFHLDWPEPLEGAEHGDVVYRITRPEWQERQSATPAR